VIIFENISWRNFLSTGQQPTTINFNKNKTTLIIGSNGAGKSTLLDALCFSLYNKPFRKINRPQLINSINDRDVFVEVNFTIGKTKWKIERGIKPNIFKIYRDGKELDQKASAIDQQKWLEQNVLKMDFRSFTQVVILGSSNFVPFMQLSAAHRREVIEDLLDIKIFSSMNTLIKEKIRQSKEEIKILDLKKESFLDKVKMQENFIEELENRGKENIQKKLYSISTLDKEVEVFMRESGILEENIFEKQKKVEEYVGASDKLRKFGTLKGKISQKVSTLTKEHKFFTENTVCPTCTQEIDDTFRINRINDAQNKAKELQSGYTELEEAIKEEEGRERQFNTITKEILKLTNDISQNNIKISGYQRQIRDLESEVQTITKQLENRNTEHEKLESFKDNLKITYDSLASKKDTINYYDFSYSLLKDGGVKSKIIKKYLPLINQQVNRYLQMMDFYINFEFDAEFNEYIKSPIHEDFSYASFSEGEKARIDLSLLFAWREVARLKNSANCNILLFDEVFDGSLDGFGADEFLKIVKYVVKDTNIFVISHKQDLQDKFDRTLIFEKIKGFSTIKEAK
jgi:DNA repair exonuclease SbcCD ATPase subunit